MTIPRLVIASKNEAKMAEMAEIVGGIGLAAEIVDGLDWDDLEETGETLEDNAILKAAAVVEATGLPALADDTGLEVAALGGLPGVNTARYAGPDASYADNVDKLLAQMEGVGDRSARFTTVMVLAFPDGSRAVARGSLAGRISLAPRGAGGFGYDPVFEVDGTTLAEMSDTDKNRISHRAVALRHLAEILDLD